MYRLLFILVTCASALCCGSSIWSLDVVDEQLLSSKVVFSAGSHSDFMTLVRGLIGKVNQNPVGKKLFQIIKERITAVQGIDYLEIEEKTGDTQQNTAFHHGLEFLSNKEIPEDLRAAINGKLRLYINLDDAISCFVPTEGESLFTWGECLYGPKYEKDRKAYYRVASIYSPFYVAIAHEFIHLKHFLDSCLKRDSSSISYGSATTIITYDDVEEYAKEHMEQLGDLPELAELNMFSDQTNPQQKRILNRLRRVIPWKDYEERRTVCGPDIDGISEMTFRIAEQLPIRYIYQDDHYFLEEASVAERIIELNVRYCKNFQASVSKEEVLARLPKNFPSVEFAENRAKKYGLDYSPLSVKLALLTNDEIVQGIFPREKPNTKDIIREALIQKRESERQQD